MNRAIDFLLHLSKIHTIIMYKLYVIYEGNGLFMKVLSCFALFGFCSSLFAEEIALQESKKIIAPQSGVYAGLGLVTSNDKYDFSLNSFADAEDDYKITDYRRTQRNYNGQLFIGYQIVTPIFAALELDYTLNKASIEKHYDDTELPGGDTLAHSAHLSMKYGNDLALKLKIGKSFSIGVGTSYRHITPYIVMGVHERSISANFDYPPLSENVTAVAPNLSDFSYASHKMKSRKLGFLWGLGASVALEKSFAIGIEYNCRKNRGSHEQKIISQPDPNANALDKAGYPRYYSINGKNSHSLTIWLSKNL